MSMRTLEELKDMLCKELDKIADEGNLNGKKLEEIDVLTHSIKSIETIIAMNEYDDDYSEKGYNRGGRGYNDGMSYARGRGRYARRDSMGRYSRDSGYSYDSEMDSLMKELRRIENNAHDERSRQEIHKLIRRFEEDM